MDSEGYDVECPPHYVLIGVSVDDWHDTDFNRHVDIAAAECSQYAADGRRFGSGVSQKNSVSYLGVHQTIPMRCSGDQAIAGIRRHSYVDGNQLIVAAYEIFCATLSANGGRSDPVASVPVPPVGDVARYQHQQALAACPTGTVGRALKSVSGYRISCAEAPMIATGLRGIGVPGGVIVSGTMPKAEVLLNGYAAVATPVHVGVTGAPGAVVPTSVTVLAGATSATVLIQSALSTAGCAELSADTGGAPMRAALIFTPPFPAGASFTFEFDPRSAFNLWNAPSVIGAVVKFPPSKLAGGPRPMTASHSIAFESSRPDLLTVLPPDHLTTGLESTRISLSAKAAGCVVLTGTVDGVVFRSTLRLATGL
jgi:hypothetical protein